MRCTTSRGIGHFAMFSCITISESITRQMSCIYILIYLYVHVSKFTFYSIPKKSNTFWIWDHYNISRILFWPHLSSGELHKSLCLSNLWMSFQNRNRRKYPHTERERTFVCFSWIWNIYLFEKGNRLYI